MRKYKSKTKKTLPKKFKKICIKCKTMPLAKTGEGRRVELCVRCYDVRKTIMNRNLKSEKLKIKNNQNLDVNVIKIKSDFNTNPLGNEDSIYWKKTRWIRLKSKFRYQVLEIYGLKCMCCGVVSSESPLEVDHIKPQSLFPKQEFDFDNTQILCKPCNMGKSNTSFTDFRSEKQKEDMRKHKMKLSPDSDIFMVHKLKQNMKTFKELSAMERVTGVVKQNKQGKKTILRKKVAPTALASKTKVFRHL